MGEDAPCKPTTKYSSFVHLLDCMFMYSYLLYSVPINETNDETSIVVAGIVAWHMKSPPGTLTSVWFKSEMPHLDLLVA